MRTMVTISNIKIKPYEILCDLEKIGKVRKNNSVRGYNL